jgi:5-methylcytosine-specific restriction endonuclease McrA
VSRELTDKLARARDLMSHANPDGELSAVLEKALDSLLEKLEKQRFAQTKRPRVVREAPSTATSCQRSEVAEGKSARRESQRLDDRKDSEPERNRSEERDREESPATRTPREHIPNEIRRAIATRDGFQCTYIDEDGHRCPSRAFLQIHHEHAHALGGPATLENLRLLCGSHNRLLAEMDFGRTHQERVLQRKPRPGLA